MKSVGTPVDHRCEMRHPMFDDPVIHVILPGRRPTATPLSDIRDAGFDVVAVDVTRRELEGCPVVEEPIGRHVFLRNADEQ